MLKSLRNCDFKNSSTSKAIISKHGFVDVWADSSLRENGDDMTLFTSCLVVIPSVKIITQVLPKIG